MKKRLKDIVLYSNSRKPISEVTLDNYVTTDNLLQNKKGKTTADSLPPNATTTMSYDENNILISNIRPYLKKIWFADRSGGNSADVLVLKVKESYNPEYIYYSVFQDCFFEHMMLGAKGTKMPRGDKNQILNYKLFVPSWEEQNSIAKVLSNLDSKIELNNQINQQLEEMAKTIYDYWFVQFDFPDEEGKPYKSSGGKMVYNKQLRREIPEGWEAPRIKDWIKESKSGDWGKEIETGNYVVPVTCIRGADLNGLNGTANLDAPDRFILKRNKNKILDSHDLIIEISGGSPIQSTGRMAFLIDESLERFEHPLICSNFSRAASLKNKKTLFNFAFQWKHYYDLGVFFNWEGRTTGIKNLLFDVFISSHSFILPEENIMNQFYDTLSPMYKQIQKNLIQNQNLASLRDWLLPMLMNGQVTVGDE